MRVGWLFSPLLHAAFIAVSLLTFTLNPIEVSSEGAVVPVEVVTYAEISNVKPVAASNPEEPSDLPEGESGAEAAPPEPAPAPTPATPDKKPEKPAKQLNYKDLLEDLQDQKKQPGATSNSGGPVDPTQAPRKGVGEGTELTMSEQSAIMRQMRECWRAPVDMADPAKLVVQIRVRFERNGALVGAPEPVYPASLATADPALRAAASSALRAIRLCNPLAVNPARTQGGSFVLSFDPREMMAQ
jgi:hypothetical protein